MRVAQLALLIALGILLSSCKKKESSASFLEFDPEKAVMMAGTTRSLSFTETGSSEGWSSGYGDKDWHYFCPDETDDLVGLIQDVRDSLKKQLSDDGAEVHGVGENSHAFISFTLRYRSEGRRGFVEILAAQLETGTGMDVRIREVP